MTYVEMPLWLVIVLLSLIGLILIYLIFGDLIANVLIRIIKEDIPEEDESDLENKENDK